MLDRNDPWRAIFILHGSIADFFHQHSPREQKVRELGPPTLPEHISQHFLQAERKRESAPTCALKYLRRETTIVIFYIGIYCTDGDILFVVGGKKVRQFPDSPLPQHLPFGIGYGRLKKTEGFLPPLKQLGNRWKLACSLPKALSKSPTHFPPKKSQSGDSGRSLRVSK